MPREIYYDVALLLLDTTGIEFKSHIWPACLYDLKMRINDQDLFTSGWIRKGKKTNLMVKTQLTSVANNQCQTFYGKNIYEVSIPFGISDNLFCANAKSHEGKKKFSTLLILKIILFQMTADPAILFTFIQTTHFSFTQLQAKFRVMLLHKTLEFSSELLM